MTKEREKWQETIKEMQRQESYVRALAVECVLIEEMHKNENYILFQCDCGATSTERENCIYYEQVLNKKIRERGYSA